MSKLSDLMVKNWEREPVDLEIGWLTRFYFSSNANYFQTLFDELRSGRLEGSLAELLQPSEEEVVSLAKTHGLFVYYRISSALKVEMYLGRQKLTKDNYADVGQLVK